MLTDINLRNLGQWTFIGRQTEGAAVNSALNFHRNFGSWINLLNPTGHVMHQQFNIQHLYVLPKLYLCVLYLSEDKQRLVPLTA